MSFWQKPFLAMQWFSLLAVLASASAIHQCDTASKGGECRKPNGHYGPAFLQFKSLVKQTTGCQGDDGTLCTPEVSKCAPFSEWPDVDRGVTCGGCKALVLAAPYQGRCDRYCASFGHRCTAAAEEKSESCEAEEEKRCDEEISDTSDILCTCERDDGTPSPGPAPTPVTTTAAPTTSAPPAPPGPPAPTPTPAPAECWAELPDLATEEGQSVGEVPRGASVSACRRRCDENAECKSISFCPEWGCWLKDRSFTGTEPSREKGSCKTHFKTSCDATTTTSVSSNQNGYFKLRVVSYNIYWWNAFGQNPWKGERILNNIKDNLVPDAIGLQECDSRSRVEDATGLQRASTFAGAQGVMVDPSRLRVVPGTSGSEDLQATGKWGPRHVTFVQLADTTTGRTFWIFNTHWCVANGNGRTCNEGVRYTGAQNMLRVIQSKAGNSPVVVTGDFNADMDEDGPQHFFKNGFKLAVTEWVDAIFYTEQHWRLVAQGKGDAAQSDHRPIFAELELL